MVTRCVTMRVDSTQALVRHFAMIKLLFLGTSSGVPTRHRNVSALAVRTGPGKDWWMVDCGEATQHQLQKTRLSIHDLVGICITHVHGDHTYGLPGLLASAAMTGRTRPLLIVGPAAIREWIEVTLRLTETFQPFPIEYVVLGEAPQVYRDEALCITQHPLSHRAASVAFRFEVAQRRTRLDGDALKARGIAPGPAWKQLQSGQALTLDDGSIVDPVHYVHVDTQTLAIVVGGDNDQPELLTQAMTGASLLVHEATFSEAMLQKVGPAPTHTSVLRVARFAQAVGAPNLILTHLSARFQTQEQLAALEAEARDHYRGNVHFAEDFAQFTIDAAGCLTRTDLR